MTNRNRRIAVAVGLGVLLSTPLAALDLPRGTLWRVDQSCVLNQRTTGSPFPCLKVDLAAGYAVLRAPFRQTHVVTMPTARVTGVDDPLLRRTDGPNYLAEAWDARSFVRQELQRPLGDDDIGLAVNSRLTRSQDQLHIHVDCLALRIKRELAPLVAGMPTDSWRENGFTFWGQHYWTRRLDKPTLVGTDVFALADEIPAIKAAPALTTLAVIGVTLPQGGSGFALLVGQSNSRRNAEQSTAEDLLDHKCRRDG